MYKEIELETQEGKKTFPFLATGTTAYRYKQCFHQDLMIALNNMEDTADDQADMTVGDKLAFIMNAQAEKRDMNKLNVDAFLEWADQFDGAALFLHMKEFVSMYLGSRQTTSTPKKGAARQNAK